MKEFQTLTSANTVYKLIGPVLVEQDQGEAKANVDKRLEFIRSELCVLLVVLHIVSLTGDILLIENG